MIENTGELNIEGADSANIPVDIWLHNPVDWVEADYQYNGEQDPKDLWLLSANNYMPRKARLGSESGPCYEVWGTEQELRDLIAKYIIPLYETALNVLKNMSTGNGNTNLHYWDP